MEEVSAAYESGALGKHRYFPSEDDAAKEALSVLEPISGRHGIELGGFIFKSGDQFTYGYPVAGNEDHLPYLSEVPRPRGAVAGYHTHPSGASHFSFGDVEWVNGQTGTKLPLYLIGNGQIRVCDVGSSSCSGRIASQFGYDERNRGLQGRIVR